MRPHTHVHACVHTDLRASTQRTNALAATHTCKRAHRRASVGEGAPLRCEVFLRCQRSAARTGIPAWLSCACMSDARCAVHVLHAGRRGYSVRGMPDVRCYARCALLCLRQDLIDHLLRSVDARALTEQRILPLVRSAHVDFVRTASSQTVCTCVVWMERG